MRNFAIGLLFALCACLPISAQITQPDTTGMIAITASGAGIPDGVLTCNAAANNLTYINTLTNQHFFCNGTAWAPLTAATCRITSAITLSTSATNVCSWSIGANAVLAWSCTMGYAITAGTLPTLTVGMAASQAPVGETGYANILTSNSSGGAVNGSASSTSSGNVTLKVGGSVVNGTYQFTTFGVIQGSATAGTFAITASLGGTTPAGTIPVGGSCTLW